MVLKIIELTTLCSVGTPRPEFAHGCECYSTCPGLPHPSSPRCSTLSPAGLQVPGRGTSITPYILANALWLHPIQHTSVTVFIWLQKDRSSAHLSLFFESKTHLASHSCGREIKLRCRSFQLWKVRWQFVCPEPCFSFD